MTINRSAFARQVVGVVFVAFTIAFTCCFMPQRAAAEDGGGALVVGGTSSGLATHAEGDLQFAGLSGDSVTGSGANPSAYTVYVRDGDAVEFTLAVKNNTSSTIECVNMVDSSAYSGAGEEEIAHFSFPERSYANSFESLQSAATNAQWYQDAMLVTNYEGYIYEGYDIAANTTATVKMGLNSGNLPVGEHNLAFTLGRRGEQYVLNTYSDGAQFWDPTGRISTLAEYVTIPVKVVVYAQEGAALSVGTGSPEGAVQLSATEPYDFGTIDLSGGELSGTKTFYAVNARNDGKTEDDQGSTTSVTTTLSLDVPGADATPFSYVGAQAGETSNLQPNGSMSLGVDYDASDFIAGTYTGSVNVTTVPRSVSVNGGAASASGVYAFPIKITLTGENQNLDARVTDLSTEAGNGLVQLSWTPADTASDGAYYVYRREGVETKMDPDTWTAADWSNYTQVGSVAVAGNSELTYADGTAKNGTTYSYTVLTGGPCRGYAATPVSETPSVSSSAKILAPMDGWDNSVGVYGQEGSVYVYWNMNQAYGGESCDGAGIVDHFNVYRDGLLVCQVYQSAVDRRGEGTQSDPYEYSWSALVPVPELYMRYTWKVSAVSANGVEGELSEDSSAWFSGPWGYSLEQPVIVGHDAEYYSGEGLSIAIDHHVGNNHCGATLAFWRKEGTSAPSTAEPPMATVKTDYDNMGLSTQYVDTSVAANKAYTYTVRATDSDGNASEDYTFTVYTKDGAYYENVNATWSVEGGTTPTLRFYDYDETAKARVYRNGVKVAEYDNEYHVYRDTTAKADGTYTYRVDYYHATGDITVTGRTYTFVRDSHAGENMLQPPEAPTLTGRISGEDVVLSWTPAATGGPADGWYVYRKNAGKDVEGWYNRIENRWNGSAFVDTYVNTKWGNGRYLVIRDASTSSFVDTSSPSKYKSDDGTNGFLQGIPWGSDGMVGGPHEWYIRAYNEAGVSAPSQVVSFSALGIDEYNRPILPTNTDTAAPGTPVVNDVWVDWDDDSSFGLWDTMIGGNVRVAWDDVNPGGAIDGWNVAVKGTVYHQDAAVDNAITYSEALVNPGIKQGEKDFNGASVNALPQSNSSGDYERTVEVAVTAQNSFGSSGTARGSAVVRSLPRFYALPGNGKAVLRWTDLFNDSTTEVQSWEIWRKGPYGVWEKLDAPSSFSYANADSTDAVKYYEYVDEGLSNGYAYEYKVVVKCGVGNDHPSVVREVTPQRTAASEMPSAPTNLTANVVNGEIALHWTYEENAPRPSYFRIMYRRSSETGWTFDQDVSGDSTSAVSKAISAGDYEFFVWAYSYIDGERTPWYPADSNDYSAYVTASPIATATLSGGQATSSPSSPVLTATPGDHQVTLSWPAVSGATYYTVEREAVDYTNADPMMSDATIAVVPGQQAYTFTDYDAVPGVWYRYDVTARNGIGGTYSSVTAKATGQTRDEFAAAQVGALIEALPTVDDVASADPESDEFKDYEQQLADVQGAYDSLTAKQKSLVDADEVQKLEDVSAAIVACKFAAVVGPVQQLIGDLPSVDAIAAVDEAALDQIADQVAEARAAYNSLPVEAKPGVSTAKLEDAEQALVDARRVIADKKAAAAVSAVIDGLPSAEELIDNDRESFEGQSAAISAAREAYDGLTLAQQGFVDPTMLEKLEACEARVSELVKAYDDAEAAASVIAEINDIPDPESNEFTLSNAGAVVSAREAYAALTGDQQALVDAAGATAKLASCEARIEQLKEELAHKDAAEAAAVVDGLIEAIPHVDDLHAMTLADRPSVQEARDAFERLTDEAKTLVTPEIFAKLEAAEDKIAHLEADAVGELIANLPDADKVTLDDEATVAAARKAFDALTEVQQGYLPDAAQPRLEGIEARIAQLKADAAEAARIDISGGELTVGVTNYTFSGAPCKPDVLLFVGGNLLIRGVDFTVSYERNVNAGQGKVILTGIGDYKGETAGIFTIAKAANPLSAKAKAKTLKVKYKKLKKKAQKVAALAVSGGQGKLTYKIVKVSAKKKLLKQAKKKIKLAVGGKLALKKKLKKGTYKVTVRVSASGNGNYLPASRDVTVKLRVK